VFLVLTNSERVSTEVCGKNSNTKILSEIGSNSLIEPTPLNLEMLADWFANALAHSKKYPPTDGQLDGIKSATQSVE
jgi:hypothetical protein